MSVLHYIDLTQQKHFQDIDDKVADLHSVKASRRRLEDCAARLNSATSNCHLESSLTSKLSLQAHDLVAAGAAAQDNILLAVPESELDFDQIFDLSMLSDNDLMMQPENWLPTTHLATGRSFGHPTNTHNRQSSLSSLGSASTGPASPFSQSTSNPHIAINDSIGDNFTAMSSLYEDPSFSLAKQGNAAAISDGLYGQGHTGYATNSLPMPHATYGNLLALNRPRPDVTSSHSERGLQPPPDLSMSSNRSQPVSVASSIASNSPATPSLDQSDEDARRQNGETNSTPLLVAKSAQEEPIPLQDDDENDECSRYFNDTVTYQVTPKLNRTMTDIYSDELYNPNFAAIPTSAPSASTSQMVPSSQDMYAQRLQQINNQRLSAASHQSPMAGGTPRERSPFRQNSPMAMASNNDLAASAGSSLRFGSTPMQQQQQHHSEITGQNAFRSQMARSHGTSTPQTISPKDAVLDYRDSDAEGDGEGFSLFAQSGQPGFPVGQIAKILPNTSQVYPNMASGNPAAPNFGYMPPQINHSLQLPQYPYAAQQHASPSLKRPLSKTHSPAPAVRPVASLSELSEPVPGSQRQGIIVNDGGTYTCTYHGCTQRFETPSLLQKHKREGHRQVSSLASTHRPDSPNSQSLLNSQAGPHRCERINPSTGKPCNTVFSRPYDLTRHEDTIHNGRKQKVRCSLCKEEKTFSRADALTRHFRVCHPEIEFAGKHRKRGVHTS
ncbi:hypothetical protein SEPCBS119000_001232 [Sporothrix epigloea]|uniref:C2H2-type domain-containing protein n=1 Tax=Sporothrix epigloea TaxID=1892477 RepID=A0ABP0D9J6_9PEZI